MTQQVFTWTFPLATPFWALLIFAPAWRWTPRIMASPWVPVLPLACYFAVALPHFGELWQAVSRPDLALLQAFAGSSAGAALIWAQLIAFDLFLGRWMYFEGRRLGIPWWLVSPVLVLTIFLSPFGLVVFLIIRSARLRSAP